LGGLGGHDTGEKDFKVAGVEGIKAANGKKGNGMIGGQGECPPSHQVGGMKVAQLQKGSSRDAGAKEDNLFWSWSTILPQKSCPMPEGFLRKKEWHLSLSH